MLSVTSFAASVERQVPCDWTPDMDQHANVRSPGLVTYVPTASETHFLVSRRDTIEVRRVPALEKTRKGDESGVFGPCKQMVERGFRREPWLGGGGN